MTPKIIAAKCEFQQPLRSILLLLGLLLTGSPAGVVAQNDDLTKELPRIPPRSPTEAMKSFQIHDSFRLEAVAVEPMVINPVSVCYDAHGRLYVVEMRGYPFPEKNPSGRVIRLEDRDSDGRFETQTVFLDGLSWPTGIVPYSGGVFIAVAPDIVYAKDTNSDGIADVRNVMFTGFGTDNVQGLLNGLLWGPDGWIYGVASVNGGTIQNRSRPQEPSVSVRGRDFRFKPDGSAFEAISGGGQFGHSFDDWGHRFTCSNSNHIRQIVLPSHYLERSSDLIPPPVALDIAAEGPASPVYRISPPEPWRVVRTRQRVADPAMLRRLPRTELFATGFFTSATGITIYRGSVYPPEFHGNAFVGDVGGNLVHRKILELNGATYRARRADQKTEFLASTDNWFRPVNFANTPEGTLLILDMYRETIEHPVSIPEPIKKHLDLTSGRDRGRLYALVYSPEQLPPRRPNYTKPGDSSTAELVKLLAHPDAWWRETAQRLLFERQDRSAAPLLHAMVRERPNALGRLHAAWALELLSSLDAASIELGLTDPEPRVREAMIRLAEARLAHEPGLLAKTLALAADSDAMVRFQLALSLGGLTNDPHVLDALQSIARKDATSQYTRIAVLCSIAGNPLPFLDVLAKQDGFLPSGPGQLWIDELAFLVGCRRKADDARRFLERLQGTGVGSGGLMHALLALARGQTRRGGSFESMIASASLPQAKQLLDAAAGLVGAKGPLDDRLTAIRLLGLGDRKIARQVLPDLLAAHEPTAIQLAVLQAMAGFLDRSVSGEILDRWKAMSPSVRREATEVLFGRREGIDALLAAIESRSIAPSELDLARLRQLESHSSSAIRTRVQKILASGAVPSRDRVQVVLEYRPALLLAGSRERGREIFAKACASCHQAEGRGVDVGPNLATVTGRSPEDLLVHILDPNREVAPNFVNYNVATVQGRVISGIITEESASAIILRRSEGATDAIPREQIEQVQSTGVSLMPEGLEKVLTVRDFADLIAFVRTIRATAPPAN
jgi:putative membrane-bound dehydrogenase-like protein